MAYVMIRPEGHTVKGIAMLGRKCRKALLVLSAAFAIAASNTGYAQHSDKAVLTDSANVAQTEVLSAPHRETVSALSPPFNAIAHVDFDESNAATLSFGPASSQI